MLEVLQSATLGARHGHAQRLYIGAFPYRLLANTNIYALSS